MIGNAGLKYHVSEHGLFYASAVVSVLLFGAVFLFTDYQTQRRPDVRDWPKVDASVVSSEISEVNSSTDTNFSTRLIAKIRFRYEVGNKSYDSDYVGTWSRKDSRDWSEILAPGAKLPIRVCPERESLVSLWDHNGVP